MTRRRAGFTLVEAVIAVSLVGLVALLLGSALLTSSQVSSESYVEGEVVGLATRVLDEATDPLAMATAITEADGLHVRVQHTWGLPDGSTALGAALSPGQRFPGWSVELRWVADPVSVSEPATQLDWNFDGDTTDATTLLGHLELRVFDAPTGGAEQTRFRRPIGAARTRLVAGGAASPTSPVLNIFSRVGAPASPVTTADAALQLNLAIVHDPIPGANGQPERHALRVTRTVALR